MNEDSRKALVGQLLDHGFLVGPDLLSAGAPVEKVLSVVNGYHDSFLVVTHDVYHALLSLAEQGLKTPLDINWLEFDHSRVMFEKQKTPRPYSVFLDMLHEKTGLERVSSVVTSPGRGVIFQLESVKRPERVDHTDVFSAVTLVRNYDEPSKKRTIKDFVTYYKHRYQFLSGLLRQRPELQGVISLQRARSKQENEQVSLLGLVYDKIVTKNGNILVTLEDATGHFKIFFQKDGPLKDLFPLLTYDEIIGVVGFVKHGMVFAQSLFFPDVPVDHKGKTTPDEVYAVFISDVHVGSKLFLEDNFLQFVDWLNGKTGNETQKTIAGKVKYLFVVGDVVDGVGVYPGQESELAIPDVYQQYLRTKELFGLIRKDIQIIMCPGNHDAVRIAEPQPRINEFSAVLLELPNLTVVSNPAVVKIHSSKDVEGVSVLLYHGYSYDYYAAEIEPLRRASAYNHIDVVMKYLLQKRHLAPSHASTLYLPSTEQDSLLIDQLPDIFVSGHVHKSAVSSYNGVLLIGCSCWQAKTAFQEKLGHHPDPGRVPVVNLKTREVVLMNFCDGVNGE